MDFNFEGFGNFEATNENLEVKKTRKFDRMWHISRGGSVCQKPLALNGKLFFGSLDGLVMVSSPTFYEGGKRYKEKHTKSIYDIIIKQSYFEV